MADDETANPDSPEQQADTEDRGTPSLQEIIAKQKAKLRQKLAKHTEEDEAGAASDGSAEPAAGDATGPPAPGEAQPAGSEAPAEAEAEGLAADQPQPGEGQDSVEEGKPGQEGEAETPEQDGADDAGTKHAKESGRGPQAAAVAKRAPAPRATPRRFSALQVALLMNTVLIALVVGSMFGLLPLGRGQATREIVVSPPPAPQPPSPGRTQEDPTLPTTTGMSTSIQAAEQALANKRYDQALERFRLLLAAARTNDDDVLIRDFLRLRIAQCLRYLGRAKQARTVYEPGTGSISPIVAAVANYHLALMDESQGLYLLARMRGYRAIAALHALKGSPPLGVDCEFLIARALTRKVKRFHQAEDFIPWPQRSETDPFVGLNQQELSDLLAAGALRRKVSALDAQVQIERVRGTQAVPHWAVRCTRAPLEEVIHQFASAESADVQWMGVSPPVRLRTVSLRLPSISSRRLNEVACGMAGLIARFTLQKVQIHDPHSYTVMSKQRDLLAREAESMWRGFFLRAPNDARVAVGRFALAGLGELSGNVANALREYQLVSRRFKREDVAPRALVRCARIRYEKLRDYRGARQDLLDLLNIWPEYGKSAEVSLILGRTCLEAGLLDEALKVFCRLYHLNLTAASRKQACLGAGDCFQRKGDFKEASRWLVRYIGLAGRSNNEELAQAYLLLGRSQAALGETAQAAVAFQRALARFPTARQYVAAALGLTRACLDRKDYLSAAGALERLRQRHLRPREMQEYLLLTARALREMGLPGKAQLMLADGAKRAAITDPQIRAEILVELARCCLDSGDLAEARKWLLEAVARLKPGNRAWEARLELADVCLRLGSAAEAVAVARVLSQARCPAWVRQRATEILVAGYVMQQNFQGAAGVLSGVAMTPKGAAR